VQVAHKNATAVTFHRVLMA